jgi:oligogalacturonide lyase
VQRLQVHPRFSVDGLQVVFTADPDGYGNLYLVDVPDFDGLPVVPLKPPAPARKRAGYDNQAS